MKLASLLGTVLFVASVIGLLSAAAMPVEHGGYEEKDIKGRYVFITDAEFVAGPVLGPAVAVGYMDFDGHGQITFATQSLNAVGQVFNEDQTASGTYSVEPDGRGKLVILPDNAPMGPFTFDVVLLSKKEMVGSMTNTEVVGTTRLVKQKKG